jgi:hypothetical protein
MAAVILPSSDAWVIDSARAGARCRVTSSLPLMSTDSPVPLLVVLDTLTFVVEHGHHVTMQSAALARGLVHPFAAP